MTSPHDLDFDDQRIEKARGLGDSGLQAYPHTFERKDTILDIRRRFHDIGHDKSEEQVVTAGRIYTVRDHGKTVFADLGDESGRIQLYIRKNDIGPEQFDTVVRRLDRGDIAGVSGHVFRTKLGEITIWVDGITILSKALCALPEKFHGLRDVEKRYRNRYIDLIVNEESREKFRVRSRVIAALRRYLEDRGFLEFETPILQPVYGGANARPFTTFHHALSQNLFLRIAPELYLKRLVVGGFEKVFEVARNFRNEDIDSHHNPEFSMVEIYEAYRDYNDMIALSEGIISHIVNRIHGTYEVCVDGTVIDFTPPWRRLSMEEAVLEYAGIEVREKDTETLRSIARDRGIKEYEEPKTWREFLVLFFENLVEDQLVQPTFVHDFPVENSPLAKSHRVKEGFTERFELFIYRMEIANGFSELNDPLDQQVRFEAQDRRRLAGDCEAQMIDYDFINALGYGMPPTGGVGIGIDRLVMLITGSTSIKEVILFPQMKSGEGACDQEPSPDDPEQ
ncbi:MAG: lysine--tRNA ligase [Methanoregulaceae archaeon]|nr:lysine--tRNA ligase [Methanoregulaceae archaeon]